jgi:maltokinase
VSAPGGGALAGGAPPDPAELAAFVSRQRWFSAHGAEPVVTDVRLLARVSDDPPVDVLLLEVEDAGVRARYQLQVETTPEPVERLEHVRIGSGPCYDALHDREVTGVWPRLVDAGASVGDLACHAVRHEDGPQLAVDRPSLVLTGEQSNTTLAFGDSMVMKFYRQVSPGVNPDVEVHLALDSVGCKHIATPLGWVDSDAGVLAFVQEFLSGATEGWESAQASVRDLFVEADLHPADVGSDFAGEAERLGRVTAELHASLREALPTAVLGSDRLAQRAQSMKDRLVRAVEEVPALAPSAPGLLRTYDELLRQAEGGATVAVQRIHGDFHLGQTLRTPSGWKVLDFEGEPASPADERRALDTPLRDVAGMLRSLDYAARLVQLDHKGDAQIAYRASEWVEHNVDAFCAGYASAAGADPRDDAALLRALVTEKAVYEVVYESRMRPSWVVLPLGAVERLAG